MALPTLDLHHFISGTKSQKVDFCETLVKSFGDHGFFKLVNHGFSEAAIDELFLLVHGNSNVFLEYMSDSRMHQE